MSDSDLDASASWAPPPPVAGSPTDFLNHCSGEGLEFGPGLRPMSRTPYMSALEYCDVHDRAAFVAAHPEYAKGKAHLFPPRIQYRFDFETEPFERHFHGREFDFVILSHVLEHLVNPLRMLDQVHRLLRPDGVLLLTLPDPRDAWESHRPLTPLSDVVRRHQADQQVLTREQAFEFMRYCERDLLGDLTVDSPGFEPLYQAKAAQTVHVNVWLPDGALQLVDHANAAGLTAFELVDGRCAIGEYTFVLRRRAAPAPPLYPATVTRVLHTRASVELAARLDALETRVAAGSLLTRKARALYYRLRFGKR